MAKGSGVASGKIIGFQSIPVASDQAADWFSKEEEEKRCADLALNSCSGLKPDILSEIGNHTEMKFTAAAKT